MDITIIGAGVAGLSCGIRLQEAGWRVRIWARELPPDTTSNVAAAVWYPYKAYPEELVLGWSAASYAAFSQLADVPGSGVLLRAGIEIFPQPVADPWWRAAVASFRRATPAELPDGYTDGYVFATPIIEMDSYLRYLRERFERGGGVVSERDVRELGAAFAEADVVVNCTGLGARELVGDPTVYAIRGQVVRVARSGVEGFVMDEHGARGLAYIVARANDCILGGVAEPGRELRAAEPATAAAIIARCTALDARLAGAAVLEHRVGLRPGRATVRLEAERWAGDGLLIHNYGHGGAGVTLSWGCADAVAALVADQGARR